MKNFMLVTNQIPLSAANYRLISSPLHDVTRIYSVHVGCHGRILYECNTTLYVMNKVMTYLFSEAP